jgi:DNA-binding transcriptional regulator YhcF (GntR family)
VQIVLNRRAGHSVRDQIVAQLELTILSGQLAHGEKLPSVRALARRLKVHHNTVSAAYQDLEHSGHVILKRGAGVFVRHAGPVAVDDGRGLDEMIRLALLAAFRKGHTGLEIRAAVERWLAAAPPDRVVIVDPVGEMAEILCREIASLGVRTTACTPEQLQRDPSLVVGALAVCLPYHSETVARLAPGCALEEITIEVAAADRQLFATMPAGSIVLVVSHSPSVLPFATVFLSTLRGDDLLVETATAAETRRWRRLVPAADIVVTDVVAEAAVRKAGARRVHTFRMVSAAAAVRLGDALKIVAMPRP